MLAKSAVNNQMGQYSSFILRIWVEDGEMMRGNITHVGTRANAYFVSFDKMLGFIGDNLGPTTEYSDKVDDKGTVITKVNKGKG